MKEHVVASILVNPKTPMRVKTFLAKSALTSAPAKVYIRHCTAKYVIMTDKDLTDRVMGEYMLGKSFNLKFLRQGAWVLVMDTTSKQYTIIPSTTKTAGFGRSSRDDNTTLEVRLQEKILYSLLPVTNDAWSFDFKENKD